jgi:hypothetical protein
MAHLSTEYWEVYLGQGKNQKDLSSIDMTEPLPDPDQPQMSGSYSVLRFPYSVAFTSVAGWMRQKGL